MKKENILITNLKSSISFLKKHSKFAGDLAVWRQFKVKEEKINEKNKILH